MSLDTDIHDVLEIWIELEDGERIGAQMHKPGKAYEIMKKMSDEDGTTLECKARLYGITWPDALDIFNVLMGYNTLD